MEYYLLNYTGRNMMKKIISAFLAIFLLWGINCTILATDCLAGQIHCPDGTCVASDKACPAPTTCDPVCTDLADRGFSVVPDSIKVDPKTGQCHWACAKTGLCAATVAPCKDGIIKTCTNDHVSNRCRCICERQIKL